MTLPNPVQNGRRPGVPATRCLAASRAGATTDAGVLGGILQRISNSRHQILGNTGGYNAGTSPDLNNFYDVWQASADYQVSSQLRLGALWGRIEDKSGHSRGASGGSIGAHYDLSKRTMPRALVDTIRNDSNGGWRPAGSGGLKSNFSGADANGRRIDGMQLGIVHKF